MIGYNAQAAEFEIRRLQECCESYRATIESITAQRDALAQENKRLVEAIESYLVANDPSEFGCACDLSVGHLCGPCFAHKQQTPLREALATVKEKP